ncbi:MULTISPECIES: secondary thiamine-phosphate synthase enzyme YjbQ [Halomonadaceae]|jgi:secondary thiamine-phosphate synthase enzyme|uniref:secondary thiamine-phosphate synthase enzyme YjbQ n=1 Tax=Halomonadaceae TaxID=28256 RepID=UPI0015832951|nr:MULTISPECIES: secondary thiamine-phosphate synthase enzyme YjbQ [Halomonas]MDI4637580.1 secondary thiamine-phosphate synthase enzyme YjbQ [Halomonas sp. BMC7]NUJ58600.1 YjbQ family protein [Halomonas taeanensis]|tara:strand:- start:7258 stop:7677 length:420 start_codon:yes stop_codon:yes gene_type:complete
MWQQHEIRLAPRSRGFHLITGDIEDGLADLAECRVGLVHLQLMHTSASLTLNENADPDVRHDMDAFLRHIAPGDLPFFRHTMEGPDDMPGHIGASLFGTQLTLAVRNGRLALGTWQGVWLGEHRDHGGSRRILATLNGE